MSDTKPANPAAPVMFAELHAVREQLQALDDRMQNAGQDARYELNDALTSIRKCLSELAYTEAWKRLADEAERG